MKDYTVIWPETMERRRLRKSGKAPKYKLPFYLHLLIILISLIAILIFGKVTLHTMDRMNHGWSAETEASD